MSQPCFALIHQMWHNQTDPDREVGLQFELEDWSEENGDCVKFVWDSLIGHFQLRGWSDTLSLLKVLQEEHDLLGVLPEILADTYGSSHYRCGVIAQRLVKLGWKDITPRQPAGAARDAALRQVEEMEVRAKGLLHSAASIRKATGLPKRVEG